MIYDKDWKRQRRTNFLHPTGLITFPSRTPPKQPQSIFKGIIEQIKIFTMNIHGVRYMWEKDFQLKMRLFWFVVVVGSMLTCFFMYLSLSSQYSKSQLETIVADSQMPIYSVNFPAIALCSWTHVNWLRLKAAEEKFLPPTAGNKTKQIFYDLLRVLDEMELSQLDSLALLQKYAPDPDIEKIPIDDLADFMALRCEELFVDCYYDETKYECCKIFTRETTVKGICMVFNSLASEESKKKMINDKFYPRKNRKAGEGSGLQFTLRYNKSFQRPESKAKFGIHVMVKQSDAWSETLTNLFLPNLQSYLAITPIISETLPNTKHLDPRTRNCLFPNEKSRYYDRIEGLTFNKLNCIIKCQQKNFIKICNCSVSRFFPKADARDCGVADFRCIYDNRDIFTYIKSPMQDDYIMDARRGAVCDCVDSCTSLVFLTGLNANKLPNSNASYPIIKGDIYIGQNVITKYETRLHSTAVDVIAKFGGILGLCMGASFLSLAEIVYGALKIVLLFVFRQLHQQRKVNPKPNKKVHKKLKTALQPQ